MRWWWGNIQNRHAQTWHDALLPPFPTDNNCPTCKGRASATAADGTQKMFQLSFFSAAPVSLVVVMTAAEVCWGFRIELPHLCAIAMRPGGMLPASKLAQIGGSKRTCSDPASSRTQTGPASVRRGHNLGRGDLGSSDDGRGPPDDLSCDVLLEVLLGWSGRHQQQEGGTVDARAEALCVVEGGLEGLRPANAQSLG